LELDAENITKNHKVLWRAVADFNTFVFPFYSTFLYFLLYL